LKIINENQCADNSQIEFYFYEIQHLTQSENFILIGSIIESFFGFDCQHTNEILNVILNLFANNIINSEDIKHG